jgi:Acetyltransferase (GNAT) domain
MQVIEVDPLSDPRWDRYVESHPDAVVFQHSAYLRALAREYDRPAIGLMVVSGPEISGVLPLMATPGLPRLQSSIAGRRLSSLPRTPVAGPLSDSAAAADALIEAAISLARHHPGTRLQLKPPATSALSPSRLVCHPWRSNFAYEFGQDGGEPRFGPSKKHSSLRAAVMRVQREGVKVRAAASSGDVRRWYPTMLETLRPHVVPPRRLRFFLALWEELSPRGMCELLLAEGPRGELLGGNLNLKLGRGTVFYAFNGARKDALHLRPNDVVHWHAIHEAAAQGFRRYDLGEVAAGQEGLAQFKRKFSNRQERLLRWYYPAPRDVPDHGGSDVRLSAPLEGAWRRLPLRATSLIGTAVYARL